MTRCIRYVVISFVFATFLFVGSANAQISEILKRMDTYNKSLQSLQASVKMDKHNPQLNVTDTLIGTTSFLPKTKSRGMYVRLDWQTENGRPKQESMIVQGDDYQLYSGGTRNQVIIGKVNKAKNSAGAGNVLSFMNMSKEQLKANYDVTYLGQEKLSNGRDTWHLQLIPKATTSYKAAELWVDSDGMPRQAKVIEPNSDTTTILLTGDKKNETLNPSIFAPNWPKNARKVQG